MCVHTRVAAIDAANKEKAILNAEKTKFSNEIRKVDYCTKTINCISEKMMLAYSYIDAGARIDGVPLDQYGDLKDAGGCSGNAAKLDKISKELDNRNKELSDMLKEIDDAIIEQNKIILNPPDDECDACKKAREAASYSDGGVFQRGNASSVGGHKAALR